MKALTIALLMIPFAARAGYIVDKKTWDGLSPGEKSGYAMGVFDEFITLYVGSESNHRIKQDYARCAMELDLKSSDLVEIVDSGFSDLEKWTAPATLMLLQGLNKVCKTAIEQYKRERGE